MANTYQSQTKEIKNYIIDTSKKQGDGSQSSIYWGERLPDKTQVAVKWFRYDSDRKYLHEQLVMAK